jgi:hypothetical protein
LERIIEAARLAQGLERNRLRKALLKSGRALNPLDDPFLVDFALHRWLSTSREEVYSDWLAWVIDQLSDPADVFRLFGLEPPSSHIHWPDLFVERETQIQGGRLDLVLRWKAHALLIIEVKLTTEERASIEKQRTYRIWIDDQIEPLKLAVLLVVDAEGGSSDGDLLRVDWRRVCLQIRRTASRFVKAQNKRVDLVRAALLLAFAGAAEQNLLGMPPRPLDLIDRGVLLNLLPVYNYLEEFCESLTDD